MSTTSVEIKNNRAQASQPNVPAKWFEPAADILEEHDGLSVWLDVPGARHDDVAITFDSGTLTVEAPVAAPAVRSAGLLEEYDIGDYRRTFRIHAPIDVSAISAELANGELHIRLPKTNAAKARKIAVKAGAA